MQTIELKFTKLNKLPVPDSANEMLCCKDADGDIYCFQALQNRGAGTYMFICDLEEGFTYCHLKVTAATEPMFKVGDKVLVKGYHCIVSIAAIGTQTAQIIFREEFLPSINVPLTDLTLITE